MIFPEKKIRLKDGRTAVFRIPMPSDAAAALEYMKITAGETTYLLRSPEECTMTLAEEEKYLARYHTDPDSVMIMCFVEERLVGNCRLHRKRHLKNRHRAEVGIGIVKEYWNLGIGTAMFRAMIAIAEGWGVMQLELEVFEGNERAFALYRKMGFEIVSHVPNAIKQPDGTLVSEFLMVRPV